MRLGTSIYYCMICGAPSWGDSRDCSHCRIFRHNVTGKPLVEASAYGLKCNCCGQRNMVRIEPMSYMCQKTGQVFQLKELWPK